MIEFTIQGTLPSANEVIKIAKQHYHAYSAMKKNATNLVKMSCLTIPKVHNQAHFHIVYFCPNKRKDPDNIAFAKKFIFDGLMAANKIDNDGWDNITSWEESFAVDKNNPRIKITIT